MYKKTIKQDILITCALPYANGPIHMGHLLEFIQADIWVRYKKIVNNKRKIYFICADDAHGTPIMLKAQKLGIDPEKIINKIYKEHKKILKKFNINFDDYYSTHSKENYFFSLLIYKRLKKKGLIYKKHINQLYDQKKNIFLPDRFVKGKCPKCHTEDQYGDNCEICGAAYSSQELIHPISLLSNTKPIIKQSEHLFFNLPYFSDKLEKWISSGVLQKEVYEKIKEWFKLGLKPWNISRDKPYFGFEIPKFSGKYFYVWFDASIGYISTFKHLCTKKNNLIDFNSFWNKKSEKKIFHFIGKDIIYFHSLFWPAILEGSNFRKPNKIFVHGYITVNGKKMSKSRNTFITATSWLKCVDSDSLRYYYATKISSGINDIDFEINDFVYKINSDIVNKIVNLASRSALFINKNFLNFLSPNVNDIKLYNKFINFSSEIKRYFENLEFNKVTKIIILLSKIANQYIDKKSPWKIAKKDNKSQDLQDICSMGINLFKVIMTYLKPIMPLLASKSENFLNLELTWESLYYPLLNHKIKNFVKLYERIDLNKIQNMFKNNNTIKYKNI